MEKLQCPPIFMPEPSLVPEATIESIKLDAGFGNLLDLFESWENSCGLFWEKADKLIFEKGALVGSDFDIEVFFKKTSRELYISLESLLHERYENQADITLNDDQVAELDLFYLNIFDNLFHARVHNNQPDARMMHQRMVMNGFPLTCGDAYYEWPESESEKEQERKFYEETLGLKLRNEEINTDI
jgi:hypothetical protein